MIEANSGKPEVTRSLLIVTESQEFKDELVELLAAHLSDKSPIAACTFKACAASLKKNPSDIVFLDCRESIDDIKTALESLSVVDLPGHAPFKICGVGEFTDADAVLTLTSMGMRHFIRIPVREDELGKVMTALTMTVAAKPAAHQPLLKTGKIIGVVSPKGGAGTTLIAANLAVSFAEHCGMKTAVCDLGAQCGSISVYLNMIPKYTLRDVVDKVQAADQSLLESVMQKHLSGVHVLAGPDEEQEALTIAHAALLISILRRLKEMHDITVVDLSHLPKDLTQKLIEMMDEVVLVGTVDVPSLKGLISVFDRIKTANFDTDHVHIVINRYNAKGNLDLREFEKRIRHYVTYRLHNDFRLCIEAVNTGQPLGHLDPRSDISARIREMAERFAGKNLPAAAAVDTSQATTNGHHPATQQAPSLLKNIKKFMKG